MGAGNSKPNCIGLTIISHYADGSGMITDFRAPVSVKGSISEIRESGSLDGRRYIEGVPIEGTSIEYVLKVKPASDANAVVSIVSPVPKGGSSEWPPSQ